MRFSFNTPLIISTFALTLAMIVTWAIKNSYAPLGFRPFSPALHMTLDSLIFCADMPMCFRVGTSLVFAPFSQILHFAENTFGVPDILRLSAAKSYMTGLFFLIVFGFLFSGRLRIQALFLSLFIINPFFYSAVGLIHYDISTLALWSVVFMCANRIAAFTLTQRLILIFSGGMIFENNGAILAFMFWALDLRHFVFTECKSLRSLFLPAIWSGFKYLGVAICAPLFVYVISYIQSDGNVFFLKDGGTPYDLIQNYGAKNTVKFTISKIGEVTWVAWLCLIIYSIVSKLRNRGRSSDRVNILRDGGRSFVVLCCLLGFMITIGVGQLTSGIVWEWPRQFLPLSFMSYFLAASIINDGLNRTS